MATFPIYQLYIELENFKPTIWRRVEISSGITLAKLAYIIMTLFEIREYYSYQFKIDELEAYKARHLEYKRHPERLEELNRSFKKEKYGIVNKSNLYFNNIKDDGFGKLKDATKIKVKDVFEYAGDFIKFYYDPEVNWKFNIVLEKNVKDKNVFIRDLPNVKEGKGYGIIETCTNLKKLGEFREKSKNKHWREKSDYIFYTTIDNKNKSFNFDKFDVEDMNIRVKVMPTAIRKKYEKKELRDSNKIMKIKKRKYSVTRKRSTKY